MAPARLGELDVPDRFYPRIPRAVTMLLVALVCTVLAVLARSLVDLLFPGAGPFSLNLPFVLLASLFARAFAGVLTQIFSALYAWYFVLPVHGSFEFAVASDGPRVVINIFAGFMIVALAELFRAAVRRAAEERDAALARRDLYLQELDHRVKNNFAQVASLLELQRREMQEDDAAFSALGIAAARVDSIARAHKSLYRGDGLPTRVDMRAYLQELCDSLQMGLSLPPGVRLNCDADSVWLGRDRAISIGLLLNELATNAAKHAFPGRERGRIDVMFRQNADGSLCLVVEDDGVGMPDTAHRPGSLGQRLIAAFAAQAKGNLERTQTAAGGTRFVFELEGEDAMQDAQ